MSKKFMDPLAGLSDDEESDAGSSDSEQEGQVGGGGKAAADHAAGPATKKQKAIDLEVLKQHGYQGGPSVLFVPDKQDEEANWAWGSGAAHKGGEVAEEAYEEREANRDAVTSGTEESALYAKKAVEQAALLRQQKWEEQQRLKADKKKESWNQKEKRKRDEGKASRGKSYVEEEKRRAREFGIVSGFD